MIRIELKVLEGRNLKGGDFGGLSSDPYCRVITGQTTQQTHVCKMTRNPNWNRNFMLQVTRGETIRFEVMDSDMFGRDDHLGSAHYRILDGHPGQVIDTWLSLSEKGEIHIQIIYQGVVGMPGMGMAPMMAAPMPSYTAPMPTTYPPPMYPPVAPVPSAYPPPMYPPSMPTYPPTYPMSGYPPMPGPGGYPMSGMPYNPF